MRGDCSFVDIGGIVDSLNFLFINTHKAIIHYKCTYQIYMNSKNLNTTDMVCFSSTAILFNVHCTL